MTTDPSSSDASSDSASDLPPTASPPENPLLTIAWARQSVYSDNAKRYQSRFVRLRALVGVLGVLVVILSVSAPLINGADTGADTTVSYLTRFIDVLLLVLPITITALLAFSVKFDRGNNWILLRGNAETLKMELYYYRTRVGPYKLKKAKSLGESQALKEPRKDRDAILAERIKLISERIKGSPVHHAALDPYEEQAQSEWQLGFVIRTAQWLRQSILHYSSLTWQGLFRIKEEKLEKPRRDTKDTRLQDLDDPEDYLAYRLEDQFNWYRNKAKALDRQLQFFQGSIYLFGGVGTFLAALQLPFKSWVAVTTALTGAVTNYLEFKRVEASLVGYNQAADALYDIRAWWYSLPPAERKQPDKFEKLVISCEETIRSEHVSWLQDMQDKLSQLYGTGEDDEGEDKTDTQPQGASDKPHTTEAVEAFETVGEEDAS